MLYLFLLNAPWRRSRFRLKRDQARLYSHAQAFCMYYGVKEKPTLRLVRDIKIKRRQSRVRILFEKFERRLDVILVRLGWVKGLKKARKLILSGGIGISKSKDSQLLIITDSSFCLSPGDRLYILDKGFIYRHIKIRMRKVAWRIQSRCLIPSPPHPRKFDPKRFRKYVKGKRRFAWVRYARFFYNHPSNFTVNYNTLISVYRPDVRLKQNTFKYSMLLGSKQEFWKDMLRAC